MNILINKVTKIARGNEREMTSCTRGIKVVCISRKPPVEEYSFTPNITYWAYDVSYEIKEPFLSSFQNCSALINLVGWYFVIYLLLLTL